MNDCRTGVVSISNPIEDTPEGMYMMDRARYAVQKEREDFEAEHGPDMLQLRDEMEEELNARTMDAMIYGDVFVRDGKRVDPSTVHWNPEANEFQDEQGAVERLYTNSDESAPR